MKDVIEMLLEKQATLEADKEAEKALACEKIDAEYSDRAGKISAMLDMAGYEPPALVETDELNDADDAIEQTEEAQPNGAGSVDIGVQQNF